MSTLSDIWRNRPLFRIVLDELARHGSSLTDTELLDILRNEYGIDVSKPELYKVIMNLELRGYISVSKVKKELHISFSKAFIQGKI